MKLSDVRKISPIVLVRSFLFCLRYLPFYQAIKIPILLANNVKIKKLKRGFIEISPSVYPGMIRIGFHQVPAIDIYSRHTIINIENGGKIIFNGDAHIGQGAIIYANEGRLTLGSNFAISGTTTILCYYNITIENDVQFSWDTLVMDSDTHPIFDLNGDRINQDKSIKIGNKVWIGCRNLILKGTNIGDNCVIGASSVLSGSYVNGKRIIAGNPAKELREIGEWRL